MSATKPVTPENMQKMAIKLIKLLDSLDLFHETTIYAGNKQYTDTKIKDPDMREIKTDGNTLYYVKNFDMNQIPVEYNNPKTLTMTFEGSLYDELNHNGSTRIYDKINKIFSEYGLYAEQGYAWSLAAYEA